MSEVKLNLVDAQTILTGTIHGSVADSCMAALSAEPETIAELEAALGRYIRRHPGQSSFPCFRAGSEIDSEPWDAGLVIIDLAARIVAAESSYSQPVYEGEVLYHDGTKSTDVSVLFRIPSDWLFVNSVEAYRWACDRRRQQRAENLTFDARAVLYGLPLVEFIANSRSLLRSQGAVPDSVLRYGISDPEIVLDETLETSSLTNDEDEAQQALSQEITNIHSNWLMTPREDLHGRSPRDVLLEKHDFIDFDLHTRCLQWTVQGEGPPCLAPNSYAYRFGGFGTHEWVLYYDLVRHLLWAVSRELAISTVAPDVAVRSVLPAVAGGSLIATAQAAATHGQPGMPQGQEGGLAPASLIRMLERIKNDWLEQPQADLEGRVPATLIDNERRRLPEAMSAKEMIIDEDCDWCRMSALDVEMGFGPGFWHLDGCNMDEGFAFSTSLTLEEWVTEEREREEFNREFDRQMEERRQRIARGEIVEEIYMTEDGETLDDASPSDLPF